MKEKIIVSIILTIMIISCQDSKTGSHKQESLNSNVFCPILEGKIFEMIEITNKVNKQPKGLIPKVCNVLIFENKEEKSGCTVAITMSLCINSEKLTGYTFLKDNLIACYLFADNCNTLIKKENLYQLKDSIKGYPNILKCDSDLIYETPMRMYEIISKDSLSLIDSSFMPES